MLRLLSYQNESQVEMRSQTIQPTFLTDRLIRWKPAKIFGVNLRSSRVKGLLRGARNRYLHSEQFSRILNR